jgi:hypothetical protein
MLQIGGKSVTSQPILIPFPYQCLDVKSFAFNPSSCPIYNLASKALSVNSSIFCDVYEHVPCGADTVDEKLVDR